MDINSGHDYECYAGTCYHCEQYAEKIIKQKLLELGAENVNTHRLMILANDLSDLTGYDIHSNTARPIRDACEYLSRMYDESRYPDGTVLPAVLREDAEHAMFYAAEIERWVHSLPKPGEDERMQRLATLEGKRRKREAKRQSRRYNELMDSILALNGTN